MLGKHRLADPCEAYNIGAEKLDDVLAWCAELQIRAVTLWVCSIDNLRRSPDELSGILAAVETKIGELAADPAIGRLGVRVKAVGRLDLLPASTGSSRSARGGSGNDDRTGLRAGGLDGLGGPRGDQERRPRSRWREENGRADNEPRLKP